MGVAATSVAVDGKPFEEGRPFAVTGTTRGLFKARWEERV